MKSKNLATILLLYLVSVAPMFAQSAHNIKITEVMRDNRTGIVDEYGKHKPWVEISNVSHSTYNVRGMFLTTDKSALNPSITPEQRRNLYLHMIPNNDESTSLGGRQSLVIYDNSGTHDKGSFQMPLFLRHNSPIWIGLFDGNAVDLVDSITIQPLYTDLTATRSDDGTWQKDVAPAYQTPGKLPDKTRNKSQEIKKSDPHGFGITVLSMCIVFFCLALLYVFFSLFGNYMKFRHRIAEATRTHAALLYHTSVKTAEIGHKTNVLLKDGLQTKGIDKEIYVAVIAMALRQYEDDVHDVESGVITIRPKQSPWSKSNSTKLPY